MSRAKSCMRGAASSGQRLAGLGVASALVLVAAGTVGLADGASAVPGDSTAGVGPGSPTSAGSSWGRCDESVLVAFPCAQGFGRNTTGGRGGSVFEVTTLEDSGVGEPPVPGSLRDAVSQPGRTIVFRVGGTIVLKRTLRTVGNLTIAGQTAPGTGITLRRGSFVIGGSNVIVRYLKVRYGDENMNNRDAMEVRGQSNVVVDHVSASWGDDETLSFYHNRDSTLQWSTATETLNRGGEHGFGGIWGGPSTTFHHNLIAHNVSRNPRIASGCGDTDYRNNVVYNWGYRSLYGGEAAQSGDPAHSSCSVNLVANYYKPGPATEAAVRAEIALGSARSATDVGAWHVAGNVVEGSPVVTADNWAGVTGSFTRLTTPAPAPPITQQPAPAAYLSVLADVGATRPERDPIDRRVIEDVRTGTAEFGQNGIIQSQTEVGGWVTSDPDRRPAPTDTDADGMPDGWELAHGLDPKNPEDRNLTWGPGYTMLEKYLNSIDSF